VEQITPVHINNFIEWALREGRFKPLPNGETGLSRRTVKDIHGLLFNFFNDAIKYGAITVNPCVGTSVSYHKKKRHIEDEAETWLSVETYHKFLSWMEEAGSDSIYNKLIPIVKIVIRYGLRREELLALRWDVVSDGHIEIKRTRVKGKAIYDVEDVKSDASHRRYPITKEVEGILREIKEKQQELNIYREDGYIFCWDDGRPYRPDYISSLFKKAIIRCPYVSDDLHFHSLRHSTCSILAEEGWALEHIQEWVGHADSEITRRIYIHVRDNWKDAKADDLDEIWSRHCD
jgi:integrase